MSARKHKVMVSVNDQELAPLDEMRGDEERAVYMRRLLHQPQRAPYRLVTDWCPPDHRDRTL